MQQGLGSDTPNNLTLIRGEEGARQDLMLFGTVSRAHANTPVVLRCDGLPFGVTRADPSLPARFPPERLGFTSPFPQDLLDGGVHRLSAEHLDAEPGPAVELQLPRAEQAPKPRYTATIGAIAKNEARYLIEWYAYHRLLGFEHFTIYDNGSTDGTTEILETLAKTGHVTTKAWHVTEAPQYPAYAEILAAARGTTEWILFSDLDEFLALPRHGSIQEFLSWHRGASAIAVNWAIFGSGNEALYAPRPLTVRFVQRAERDFHPNRHAKTLVRPERALRMSVHHAELAGGRYAVAGGERLCVTSRFGGVTTGVDWSLARLNHYFCKSREEWDLKRARGRADLKNADPRKVRPETQFDEYDRNEVRDDATLAIQPALASAIAELRARFPTLAPYCPDI